MRRLSVVLMGLLVLALSGCGQKAQTPPPAAETPAETPAGTTEETPAGERNPTAAELGREETTELAFTVEGETELIPVTLYIGQGYSIYIPSEGWRLEKWVDDGIPEDTWESIVNDDVELTVAHYAGKTTMGARDACVRDEDYVFEDLMGGELGDPLTGMDEDGDFLSFMAAQSADGAVTVISWEYPAEAAEGFGARLTQIANTFELTE